MSGLREALEQLLADREVKSKGTIPNHQIRELLAAHPAEPAPVVTDAVTFQAMRAFDGKAGYSKLERLRAALEAAAPLLGPQPQVGVVHVQHADAEEYARIFNLGFAEAVEQYVDGSRSLLNREAVRDAIADELDGEGVVSYGLAPKLTGRVMELARPIPTREQIACRLDGAAFVEDGYHATAGAKRRRDYALEKADAVLALLNGESCTD